MNIYSVIDRYVLLPIAAKFQKSNILKEYISLKRTDWISREELTELQNNKLQRLIRHCYDNVPYYTKVFNRLNLKPKDIQCREDLSKLPVLTKQIIRDNYENLVSLDKGKRKAHISASGGSTGIPLKYITDKANWGIKWSSTFRAWNWYGLSIGVKIFTFGGNSLVKTKKESRQITKKDLFDRYIMNNFKYSCSDMSDKAMMKIYNALIKSSASVIRGYPASIYNIAKYINKNRLSIPKIHAVLTTGEMLLPQHRHAIQKVFKTPIYDSYGAGDGGIVSHECYMHEGLHITEEQCILEITDVDGNIKNNGEVGFVLSTDLDNYLFPFIRYQVGDMAIIKKEFCSCGRSSRLIDKIVGRTGKMLYNKIGQSFTSIIIDNMMFKNMDYHKQEHEDLYLKIDQFQIKQDKNGDIEVLIKPMEINESLDTFGYVVENFKNNFPNSKIELKYVTHIEKLNSGKSEYCISEYIPHCSNNL